MNNKSFPNRLSWKVIKVVAVLFVIALLVVAITSHQLIADEATRSTQYMLHGTISELELPLNEVEITTRTVAAHVATADDIHETETIVRYMVELDSLICGGAVLYPDRETVAATFSYQDSNGTVHTYTVNDKWPADAWVNRCIEMCLSQKKPFWVDPYLAEGSRHIRVTSFCYPLFAVDSTDGDSTLLAVVTAELPVDWMEEKCQGLRPYSHALTTIMCNNCIIGIDDSATIAGIQTAVANNKDLQALQDDMRRGKDSIRRFRNGSTLNFVVYGPLHNGWMVSIVCQYREVLAGSSAMHINLFFIGLVGLVSLFFICRRTIRRTTLPITQLSDAALKMAKGDFQTQLPEIKSQDEMKHLRDSFVYMQNSITEYIEELRTTTASNERMESELNVARNIQMGMLSTNFPPQLAAMLVPAKEVGGDLYDFIVKEGNIYFAVGDVSGKGVPASLMMAITRASLRFVAGMNLTLDQTVARINNGIVEANANNMFVTLFVGRINMSTGRFDYCNAGHNPIIIIPPDGEPFFLKAKPNLAVGLFPDFHYQSECMTLSPGTRIVAYTDGVNEAERGDKSLYGNDRLLQWAKGDWMHDNKTTEHEVVDSLFNDVKLFTEDNPQNDDITIMSLKL